MVILAALLDDDLWFCCWANKRLRRCFYRNLRGLKTTVVPGKLGRRRVCWWAVYILHGTVTSIPPPQLRTSFNEQKGSSLTVQALCLFADWACVRARNRSRLFAMPNKLLLSNCKLQSLARALSESVQFIQQENKTLIYCRLRRRRTERIQKYSTTHQQQNGCRRLFNLYTSKNNLKFNLRYCWNLHKQL